MYIIIIIGVAAVTGYGLGMITVIISRRFNNKRKIKSKYSFNQEFDIHIPSSDVSKYKHDKEEHASIKF